MSENQDTWRGARFGEHFDPPAEKPKTRIRVPTGQPAAPALPAELEATLEDLERWKAKQSEAKKHVERLRAEVMEALGSTREATCGPYRVVATLVHRKAYHVEAGMYFTLDIEREA